MQQFLPPTPLPTYWSLMSGNELSFNYITIKCTDRLVFQRLYDLDALKQEIFKVFFFLGGGGNVLKLICPKQKDMPNK